MRNYKTILIVIVIAAAVVLLGFFFARDIETKQGQSVILPDLSLSDYSGNTVKLHGLIGSPLVVNSWAVWCPFCKEELVDFAVIQEEFGDAVTIVAVDRAESLKTAKEFTDSIGITDSLLFLLDPNDSFYRAIGGFSMPETIFVDKEGVVRIHKRGPMNVNEIRSKINELLAVTSL